MMSDNDKVICPNCVHEFAAVPVNVQAELERLRDALRRLDALLRDGKVHGATMADSVALSHAGINARMALERPNVELTGRPLGS